jgi:hypothetical protein
VSLSEKEIKGDRNPKDFIVFFAADFAVRNVAKDNTGQRGKYTDGMVFPTLAFPSDHAITSTELVSLLTMKGDAAPLLASSLGGSLRSN